MLVSRRKHGRLNVGDHEQNRWISRMEKQQQQQEGVSATHSINMLMTDGGVWRLLEMDQWSSSDIPQDDGTIASTAAVVDAECLDLVFYDSLYSRDCWHRCLLLLLLLLSTNACCQHPSHHHHPRA